MSSRPLFRPLLLTVALLGAVSNTVWAADDYLQVIKEVQAGDLAALRSQVVRGDDLNHQDDLDRTGLTWAAIAGNEQIIKLLLQGGARTTIRDRDNRLPLHWAVQKDNPEAVAALLDGGANIETPDQRGTTPLMMAAANGNLTVVRLLINRHAKLDTRDYTGRSALDFAVTTRQGAVIQALKQAGAQ